MDIGEKDKYELEKRNENHINYQAPGMSPDWQFGGANLTSTPMSLVSSDNPMAIGSSCASASVVDSFGTSLWEHTSNSQNLGFCDINAQNGASSSNGMGIGKGGNSLRSTIDRPFDMSWNAASSMLRGGIFLPNATGILPQSLSQLPADSAFIDRAARFSSFNGGNFSDMVNPFGIPESMGLYTRGVGLMQGPQDIFAISGMKSVSVVESEKSKLNSTEASKDASLQVENRATQESPLKNEKKSESLVPSNEEAKQGNGGSGNESDEAEFSGGIGGQDEPSALDEVTGKAVMLDEIINYVQSLQRQVEFLSMKLATVNPRLDFNIEGLLAKDIIQSRAGPSSLGFSPDMSVGYPSLHPSQPGLVQAALPVMGNTSDVIRRTLSSQFTPMTGGYKEPNQLSNAWEDDLHNVVQMNYGAGAPSDSQDVNGSLPSGHLKVEL
ncbi:Basic helix-loop-helix DNA-binding superfamily protein, putative isoform 5 [Theobroma cacao]|uniref:Basic helix-loop-helix DNA-binding superfamily protein, putative isoform 5 n=1 Tax=Theobroma cacao TaxID=3641 RepID=A0A061EA88_THECC|nr:Basic helix-loop-helix DNA-binding superfamily protein, putative isoform 5 [Theobroma cacao]EOY01549.1 Basic helix-loop-helix DNA-binding superfamily protein, putative isoform 5 [Theobroma cacao]